jgi:tRNA G18 (ribose-2'-O)-methylase SpoU
MKCSTFSRGRANQQKFENLLVNIPMVGGSDSLNVATATDVMLYELFNQRRTPRK